VVDGVLFTVATLSVIAAGWGWLLLPALLIAISVVASLRSNQRRLERARRGPVPRHEAQPPSR
jgi:hypothetical protein